MKKTNVSCYDVVRDCALLNKDKSFKNLYSLICGHADIPAAIWLDGDVQKSLSFSELSSLTDNYSSYFRNTLGTEGRVCIALDSCKEWFPIFWGLVRSGHDILSIDPTLPDDRIRDLMNQTGCKALVCARKKESLPEEYTQILHDDLLLLPNVQEYTPVWAHDVALCTSGTTAESKIFVYNEETICYLALFSEKVFRENKRLIDNDAFKTLAFLPFHHVLGFSGIFIWSHFLGYSTIYLKDRSPQTIIKTAQICSISQIVTVPLLANSICKSLLMKVHEQPFGKRLAFNFAIGLSLAVQTIFPEAGLSLAGKIFKDVRSQILGNDIRSLVLGGSATDPKTLKVLNGIGYFTICGYGMTETAINSFETSYRMSNRIRGSVGAPMAYTEFRIKDGGKFGELQIRGKGIHSGRFVGGEILPPETDADGWFDTGDVVRIHPGLGQYFIRGRIKEVIINESGENVYPDELEGLFKSLKGIDQFTVLGVPKEGSSTYEDITYIANVGDRISDETIINSIIAEVRRVNSMVPVFKHVSKALVTSETLPTTNTLKIKRIALGSMISNNLIQTRELDIKSKITPKKVLDAIKGNSATQQDKISKRIREIYAEILKVPADKLDPDANIVEELGGDSLQVLSIATRAEDEFGIFIPAEEYLRCTTINGADQLVHELMFGTGSGTGKLTEHKPITKFEDSPEYHHFKERLDGILASGEENPYFVVHDSPLRDTSIIDGREVIDFGNYNYVGMSGREEVNEAAIKALRKYGTSASGSRLLAGEKPIHRELEKAIAQWKNADDALVCVGGHSTNVTVVGNFCGKNDLIVYDAICHNSIEQGCKLSDAMAKTFPHNDLAALEKILSAQRKYFEKVLIIIEGVYSMDGDISDVPAFVALKKKYGCFLMVDEAHSSCVLGATGGGVDEYFKLGKDDIDIKYGTLSKGLGTCGGYIAGKQCLIDYLRYNLPGFVFSVGISPALAAGSLEAIRLLRESPEIMQRLHSNIECFAAEARKRNLDICLGGKSAILPVLIGKDEDACALSTALLKKGISVPPAVYPAVPRNKARLRFDVISEHKSEQIIYALDMLVQLASEMGISLPAPQTEG